LISVHPGQELTLPAIASLIGLPRLQSRALLGELMRTRLLTEQTPGRYRTHDLVKTYAHELSSECDSDTDRAEALERLFQHYRLSANEASSVLMPHRGPKVVRNHEGVIGYRPAEISDAVRWFDAERHVLRPVLQQAMNDHALLQRAINDGQTLFAWPTASSMLIFYQLQGYWHDWVAMMSVCLDIVVAARNPEGQIRIRRGLAGALNACGDHVQALEHLDEAMRLSIELTDMSHQASCYENIGEVKAALGGHRAAIEHYQLAIPMFEALGDDASCAYLRRCTATSLMWLGEHKRCADLVAAVLPGLEERSDMVGVGECYEILAASLREQGDLETSLAYWRRAMNVYLEVELWMLTARCLIGIGDTVWAQGDAASARRSWNEAAAMLQGSGLLILRQVQERLNRREDPF
jgi:tetratricopeptide (TPR) repeat protein